MNSLGDTRWGSVTQMVREVFELLHIEQDFKDTIRGFRENVGVISGYVASLNSSLRPSELEYNYDSFDN